MSEIDGYMPFSVSERRYAQRYGGSGLKPEKVLVEAMKAAGMAVANVFAEQAIVGESGEPLVATPLAVMHHRARPGVTLPVYSVDGITVVHQGSTQRQTSYYGFEKEQLAAAHLLEPDALANACADAMSKGLAGTSLWDETSQTFQRERHAIHRSRMVADIAQRAEQDLPTLGDSFAYANYAQIVGNHAIGTVLRAAYLDGVSIVSDRQDFVQQSRGLHPVEPV